jgi:hypothetical protein
VNSPTVVVTCVECAGDFNLSARREYEHRKRGTPARCEPCRFLPKPPDPAQLEALKLWWLARYELAELQRWPPI